MQEVWFHESQLQGVKLYKSQLQGATLYESHLQGASLTRSQLQGARLDEAQLQKSSLLGVQLQGAQLHGVQLQEAYLLEAQLQGAQLQGVKLQGAKLFQVDFYGVSSQSARIFSFETRIKDRIGEQSDLEGVTFSGGLKQEDIDSLVKGLSDDVASELRTKLIVHVDKPAGHDLPENSGSFIGSYTKEEAEQWIAEYKEAMSEVPKEDNS